jgi:type I restriction enzyme M protein
VSYDEIEAKSYSLSAGQYFDVKIDYIEMTTKEFESELASRTLRLRNLFAESKQLASNVEEQLATLRHAY